MQILDNFLLENLKKYTYFHLGATDWFRLHRFIDKVGGNILMTKVFVANDWSKQKPQSQWKLTPATLVELLLEEIEKRGIKCLHQISKEELRILFSPAIENLWDIYGNPQPIEWLLDEGTKLEIL